MKKYTLSPRAREDLRNINAYTHKNHGSKQASLYLSQLRDKIRMPANNPQLGIKRDEVKKGYRSFPEGSHVIFFRIAKNKIEILGIPHQGMDISSHFVENDFPKDSGKESPSSW